MRCTAVSSGSGDGYYIYDGQIYHVDDNGDHVLVKWGISVTPIDNLNQRSLRIRVPGASLESDMVVVNVDLPGYDSSGFLVAYADPERSYDITYTLQDSFNTYTITVPLSTSIRTIEFLSGGNGIAFGKVAELAHTIDMNRNWMLNMPYETRIQNYNQDGTAVRLYDWLQNRANRIQAIADSRDIAIFSEWNDGLDALHDNNTISCIPGENVTLEWPVMHYGIRMTVSKPNFVSGLLIGDDITIDRRYLYIWISGGRSFLAGTAFGPDTRPRPTIYVMGTKPTSINQTTGVPNGTILTQQQINGNIFEETYGDVGYRGMAFYGNSTHNYIDVSSFSGQSAWIVLTVADGELYYEGKEKFGDGNICVNSVLQTDNRTR